MSDLPEGLTLEELKEGKVVAADPAGTIDVAPGETVPGEITSSEIRSHDAGSETYWYYQVSIQIDDAFEVSESWSMNGGKITRNTGLGAAVERFGADLDELQNNDNFSLDDIFVGQRVEFEVDEDDEGFTTVATDENGLSTLRPEGDELDADVDISGSSDESGGGDDNDDSDESEASDDDSDTGVEDDVLSIVAEMDGEEEQEVKKALAKESRDHITTFTSMVEDGTVTVEDGTVSL